MYLILKILNKNYIVNFKSKIKIDNNKLKLNNLLIINKIHFISNKKKFVILSSKIIKKLFIICLILKKIYTLKIIKFKFKKRKNYKLTKNYKPNNFILNLVFINLNFLKINS